MDLKDAQNEVEYQLTKLLLYNLKEKKLITDAEMCSMIKDLQKKLKPIIGCLD